MVSAGTNAEVDADARLRNELPVGESDDLEAFKSRYEADLGNLRGAGVVVCPCIGAEALAEKVGCSSIEGL